MQRQPRARSPARRPKLLPRTPRMKILSGIAIPRRSSQNQISHLHKLSLEGPKPWKEPYLRSQCSATSHVERTLCCRQSNPRNQRESREMPWLMDAKELRSSGRKARRILMCCLKTSPLCKSSWSRNRRKAKMSLPWAHKRKWHGNPGRRPIQKAKAAMESSQEIQDRAVQMIKWLSIPITNIWTLGTTNRMKSRTYGEPARLSQQTA